MEKKLVELKEKMQVVEDLELVNSLLVWDQSTYMPPGGAPARGRQSAMLAQMQQEKLVDPEIGKLLDALEPWAETLPYDSDDASLIRVTRRVYDQAVKIPPALIGELYGHVAESYQKWTEARPNNDFKTMQPYLEKTLELSRRVADCFPGYEHIADPLIDFADYGMKASSVREIFSQLRAELVPLTEAILEKEPIDNSVLFQEYPEEQQESLGVEIIKDFGFDFERGRQDITHHPFMTKFSLGDVRITTRYANNDLGDGLFSTLHESGHGMYELGIKPEYEASPLGTGTSDGVHESQSRLWENIVGRSKAFWSHYLPKAQHYFPDQLGSVTVDEFYKAINKVSRSLIRVDADEVTYNLHVMLRFDLELALLEGSLEIKDLPDAWHDRYQKDLGLRAPDDSDGVLQDVHWYAGVIGGAFQGYTLGNIMGSLFYQHAMQAHPEIPDEIAQGKFATLHTWMKENIYQYGSKYTAPELIEKVTGGSLVITPYMDYLRTKYNEIYDLGLV
jgi:carboxypeptidase Taq